MNKSLRTFAMMFALTVAAAPMMHASEPFGTNPRPQSNAISVAATIAYTVLAYFGL